jgi:hypothetical protein
MTSRLRVKPGDLFAVKHSEGRYAALQFVVRDASQLSSDVVVVYSRVFSSAEDVLRDLPGDQSISFYTHTSIVVGSKAGWWERIGNAPIPEIDLIFRCTDEFGPTVEVSDRWYWWRVNGKYQNLGRMS